MSERLEYHILENPQQENLSISGRKVNTDGNPEVCFTGFKKEDKNRLIKKAELAGMFICSSVTNNLKFLCCGYNAGPKKIEKSRHLGAIVLSEIQFEVMLETGEIPEES